MSYPKRGQIWLVDFEPAIGAEIKKKRPACIISNDISNEFALTVTVLPITDPGKRVQPYEVALGKSEVGLVKDSKIKCQQIRTIDKARLLKQLAVLPENKIKFVEKALAIHLGIIF
ncbi:MAG TPA: type II toxin-antitoxin system PemK/MazF family toxin [Candidatus Omnitrophota bacterium]|nr:type II toxin-antitoxin system PemK/MazF family toxin [Candidatus Omnitrophota bacterium]